ncbi:MAG: glutamate-1-semialdehyde 2,1-aminomutase [Solirubrobacterales bacterium]
MRTDQSERLFERARAVIPGGVNSPVRAFRSVGSNPRFIERAQGARLYDVDGNEYIDYVGSWGPLILGHAHPEIVEAIREAAVRGTSYGATHPGEVELAEMICAAFPGMERVRLVNSGTEAAMSAIRLARAFTGRNKVIKFAGCYHGHADAFLIQAGSGLMTQGVPSSPGVTPGCAADTIICQYNDLYSVRDAFDQAGEEIAAIIVEPVAGNMGLVLPEKEFLVGLREMTREFGALLIFDEVITGFRVTYGGMQTITGIVPDLTCLGKIIGGGLPVGAYGGEKRIMEMMAPEGPVYQAGTLSGNPLAVAAGMATLKLLRDGQIYEGLEVKAYVLHNRIRTVIENEYLPAVLNRLGSMLCLFFSEDEVTDYTSAMKADTGLYTRFFHGMLERGIYLPPSQFEVWFVSNAHTIEDIEKTAETAAEVLCALKEE